MPRLVRRQVAAGFFPQHHKRVDNEPRRRDVHIHFLRVLGANHAQRDQALHGQAVHQAAEIGLDGIRFRLRCGRCVGRGRGRSVAGVLLGFGARLFFLAGDLGLPAFIDEDFLLVIRHECSPPALHGRGPGGCCRANTRPRVPGPWCADKTPKPRRAMRLLFVLVAVRATLLLAFVFGDLRATNLASTSHAMASFRTRSRIV